MAVLVDKRLGLNSSAVKVWVEVLGVPKGLKFGWNY